MLRSFDTWEDHCWGQTCVRKTLSASAVLALTRLSAFKDSASCLCQTCTPTPAPQPPASPSTPQQPSTPTQQSFADRLRELHSQALQTEATVLRSISDSQQSLRRASSAIEAAYERLLALRSRLRQSLETMSSRPEGSDSSFTMGPDHSAIVLADNPAATEPRPEGVIGPSFSAGFAMAARDPSLFYSSTSEGQGQPSTSHIIRRRFTELTGALEELDNGTPRPRASLQRTATTTSNASGPRPPIHWRPILESLARPSRSTHAPASSADAATSLGRRVEARASAARTASNDYLRPDVREFMDAADTSLALLAHQQRQLLVSSRGFRQDPVGASTENAGSSSVPAASTAEPRTSTSGRSNWFARDRAALWRQNMRERRPRDADGNAGVLISFRATQGDQPTVIVRTRRGSAGEMPDFEDETDDPANRRSYRIRRRLNPEGSTESLGRSSDVNEDYDEARRRLTALSPARIWPDTPTREGEESMDSEQDGSNPYHMWSALTDRRLTLPAPSRRRRGWGKSCNNQS